MALHQTELVKGMCRLRGDNRTSHIESGKVRLSRDEKDVDKFSKHIQSFQNPFKTPRKTLLGPVSLMKAPVIK